jgi:hypothetical protein
MLEYCPDCRLVYYQTLNHECPACGACLIAIEIGPQRAAEHPLHQTGADTDKKDDTSYRQVKSLCYHCTSEFICSRAGDGTISCRYFSPSPIFTNKPDSSKPAPVR